ncbi:MAG: hypothetical protein U9O49_04470 [Candidatus Thermoplasmatota archaeon]|nr:hypothetical protein [Candidatus Thermoplasmatota archaeon]
MVEIFPCGKPVTGENLIGREEFIKRIIAILKSGQSVMLVSPRRFGKTSILLEVLRRMKKDGCYIGDIDIFDVTNKKELAEKIVITTLKNRAISAEKLITLAKKGVQKLRGAVELKYISTEGFEIILDFAGGSEPDALLDEALDFPNEFSKHHKQNTIFAYDEFSDLEKMNGDLIKKMRAKFQRHSNTTYIFSGSQESLMNRLFTDKKSAFYGFSRILSVPKISEKAFKTYITQTFKKQNIEIPENVAGCVTSKTNCHPYYTQFVCQQVYYQVKGESNVVTKDDVYASYEKTIDFHRAYFDDLWRRLANASSLQLNICRYLASGGKESLYSVFDERRQNVYHAINSLTDKGIIVKDGTHYFLIDPLFRDYINKQSIS